MPPRVSSGSGSGQTHFEQRVQLKTMSPAGAFDSSQRSCGRAEDALDVVVVLKTGGKKHCQRSLSSRGS